MTFGNYCLLTQMLVGHSIHAASFEMELENDGLCVRMPDQTLKITENGKKYLKKHERPAFPKLGRKPSEAETFVDGLGI